jgi:hypothetical protein
MPVLDEALAERPRRIAVLARVADEDVCHVSSVDIRAKAIAPHVPPRRRHRIQRRATSAARIIEPGVDAAQPGGI